MPIRTEPSLSPGLRTHSCSAVYLRSSGYMSAGYPTGRRSRLATTARLCVPGTHVGVGGGDLDALLLLGGDARPVVLQLRLRALGEGEAPGQGVRLADHVDDVRRPDQRAVD